MLILLYYKDSASQYHLVTPYTRHQLHPVRTTDSVYTTYPVSIENNSVDTPYSQSRTNPKTASGLASSALLESETAYAYPKPTGHTLVGRGSSFPAWINWNYGLTKTRHDDSRPSLLLASLLCTDWVVLDNSGRDAVATMPPRCPCP